MPRDITILLNDIKSACERIEDSKRKYSFRKLEFINPEFRAVLYDLMIIGEAVKNIPESVKAASPQIPWRRIASLRDVIIHEYFGLDREIIDDVVDNRVSELLRVIQDLLEK
jgi:uncharacterized protein with HEPN domain